MNCTHPRQTYINSQWYCRDCDSYQAEKRRRPLTAWEKQKLVFYKSDKKWQDHIRSRKIVMINGKKEVVVGSNIIPIQPKELWPKLKEHA